MTRQALTLALSNYLHARRWGRFEIVEAPDWRAEGLLFALLGRTPLIVHLHTPTHVLRAYNDEPLDRDARLVSWLERTAARRSTSVTCPAHLLVAELRAQGWLTRDVEIIRYPVDWARFRDEAPPNGSRRVLFVGRLERRKAPERLLHALADLERTGVSGTAVFVGRGSGVRDGLNYGDWVKRLAEDLGVECAFVGEAHWSEVPKLYEDANVVCVPSEFESFSMTAVEGMAAGRPVVVTHRVGAAELFAGHDAHGQVCSGDGDLAEALAAFLDRPDTAATVGAANRALVIATCDADAIAGQREALFRSLVR
jgi:glycosyltransferase involved in cell wall biosynthesis